MLRTTLPWPKVLSCHPLPATKDSVYPAWPRAGVAVVMAVVYCTVDIRVLYPSSSEVLLCSPERSGSGESRARRKAKVTIPRAAGGRRVTEQRSLPQNTAHSEEH